MHEQLKEVLIGEARAGKRVVVFIDEAQNLSEPVLETVRLLSDFENPRSKLVQIVLAGQPELADKLARPSVAQLRQRISIVGRLSRFTRSETEAYINHRLRVAGYKGGQLFSPEVCEMIAARSEGVPRNINNLCFSVLSLGYALGRKEIDCSLVQEAANDLELNPLVSKQHDSQNSPQPAAAVSRDTPLHAHGASGKRDTPLDQKRFEKIKERIEQLSRSIIPVGAVLVFLFAVGAAGALFLHRGIVQPRATAQTNPLPVASPLSTAANTAQDVPAASSAALVASRPSPQVLEAVKPGRMGKNPEPEVLAVRAIAPRSAPIVGRDAPPDLTAVALNAPADAIGGVLRASSGTMPALPPNPERIVPVPVGGHLKGPQLVSRFELGYPPAAERMGVEGEVVVDAAIDATGKVTDMNVVSGPPLLRHAALDTVRQSKYEPGYLDGTPVAGKMSIAVQFRLH
jgi:TonB family protein